MGFAKIVLFLGGAGFLGFGAAFLLFPETMASSLVLFEVSHPRALADVRAIYGGLELAVGSFFVWCALDPSRHYGGLVAMLLCFGGAGLGRTVGILADGGPDFATSVALAFEAAGAALALVALRTGVSRA